MKNKKLISSLIFGFFIYGLSANADDRSVTQKPVIVKEIINTISNDVGQPISFPRGQLNLVVSIYDIQPGAKLPIHRHQYQRFAYVMAGDLLVEQVGRGRRIYHTGDFVTESKNQWHFGENVGEVNVRLLVIDQLPIGKTATVLKK